MKTNSLKLTCSLTIFSALSLAATAQTNLLMVGDPTGSTRMDDYFWGAGFGFYVPAGGGTMINALGFGTRVAMD